MSAYISAHANQKGGVGKTTTTISFAAALDRGGFKVLMVDLDPQASLTECWFKPAELVETMYDALVDGKTITPLTLTSNISLLPTNIDLAAAEIILPAKLNFEKRLARTLRAYADDFDFIILDCPPSLGVLTRNALTAANSVLIPVATELLAIRAVPLIIDQIGEVRDSELNAGLHIWHILPTLYDMREGDSVEHYRYLQATYPDLLYPYPMMRRTDYKKAVRQQVDVGELNVEQGDFWDGVAIELVLKSGKRK